VRLKSPCQNGIYRFVGIGDLHDADFQASCPPHIVAIGHQAKHPRDKEAAHRAEVEGIATDDRSAVTCRKCLSLLHRREKARNDGLEN